MITSLVAMRKTEESLRVFADVVMDVKERGSTRMQLGEGSWSDQHQIADAADLDERT